MSRVSSLHHEAMALADRAYAAARGGDRDVAHKFFREAFQRESQAAQVLVDDRKAQPTRAILFRSAATLAVHCGLIEEAVSLIRTGLEGDPPPAIANELRGLIDSLAVERPPASNGFRKQLLDFLGQKSWTVNHSLQLPAREATFVDPT